jgi:hypothetical protein
MPARCKPASVTGSGRRIQRDANPVCRLVMATSSNFVVVGSPMVDKNSFSRPTKLLRREIAYSSDI